MAVERMQKIRLLGLQPEKDLLLKFLQTREVMEITAVGEPAAAPPPTLAELERRLAELRSVITFLDGLEAKKKGFIESFLPSAEAVTAAELDWAGEEFDPRGVIKKFAELENHLANQRGLVNELTRDLELLLPWQKLNAKLSDLNKSGRTICLTGRLKLRFLDELHQSPHLVEVVSQTKDEAHLLIIAVKTEGADLNTLLARSGFVPLSLPDVNSPPAQEITRLAKLKQEAQAEIEKTLSEARSELRQLLNLKCLHDHLLAVKERELVKQKAADSRYAFALEGWIKARDFKRLQADLVKELPATELSPIAPAEGEQPPVVLINPPAFTPFELITRTFATPKPTEIDPSLPLSLFFVLFFGLCLGDFGYGLTLTIVSLVFLKKYRLPAGGQAIFKLLCVGGIVSAVVGVLTGSYFGFTPAETASAFPWLKEQIIAAQIIDPVKNPLTMLIFSLALGLVQIFFGMILMLSSKLKSGDYFSALVDDFFWIYFLGALVYWVTAVAAFPAQAGLAQQLSLIGAIALVLTQGRAKPTWHGKLISGLLSLYKTSSYLGDTLSYSRLLALGMSSSIIGAVINILAKMTQGIPYVGVIVMIVCLVIGHVFNLLISVLGSFIHSMRLQMVEFFGKFFEGGGREFRPYKRVSEYTIVRGGN